MLSRLSDNLNILMAKARLNSSELARLTGLPATTIKRIRNNEQSNPTISTLLPIAQQFSITISDLLGCESEFIGELQKKSEMKGKLRAIPILTWNDFLKFDLLDYDAISNKIWTEKKVSEKCYSVKIKDQNLDFFPENSLLIVEPNKKPESGDYIIVAKSSHGNASIKRYITEIDQIYLKSLVQGLGIIPFTQEYKIYGVIIEYRMDLKS